MSIHAFDTLWTCGGEELDRRIIDAEDMDEALVAAWMEMPAISRQDHKPCDSIRVTDMLSGQSLTEDVPPFSPPSSGITKAVLQFAAGCACVFTGFWMARHGMAKGPDGAIALKAAMIGLTLILVAIISGFFDHKAQQDAIAQWKKDFGDLRPATGPAHLRLARVIVAHFSPWRETPRLMLGLAVTAAALWLPLASRLTSGRWEIWHPVLLAVGAGLIFVYLPPLRQMLLDRRAALWIEGGELVLCHRLSQCFPIWGIADITVEKYKPPKGFAYTALMLTGQDGNSIPISPAKIFSEPPEEIAARLKTLLRLA